MKLFGTDGVRGRVNVSPMTPEVILKLGSAYAKYLKSNTKGVPKVVIGKDTRLSGYIFESALTSGLCSHGVDVLLVGPMPTPAIGQLTRSFGASGGIVISASHNPAGDNGIKIFDKRGIKLEEDAEKEIERIVNENNIDPDPKKALKLGKAYRIEDARGRYIEFVKSTVENISLSGLKIVLDCANGAAYNVAPLIFRELGADLVVIGTDPNGININKGCGSENPEKLIERVKETKANCGIALDGDADRVVLVDENGEILDGDHIMTIAGISMLGENKLCNATIVATCMSNAGFEKTLIDEGITLIRTDVGDKLVVREMIDKGASLGGEQSGHIVFGDHTPTGDGTLTALQILSIMKKSGKKLSVLKKQMVRFPQVLINFDVTERRPIKRMKEVTQLINACNDEIGEGRILVRYSGTEMKCRVMVEGNDEEAINKYAKKVVAAVKEEISK